jgi:hypothetical protein
MEEATLRSAFALGLGHVGCPSQHCNTPSHSCCARMLLATRAAHSSGLSQGTTTRTARHHLRNLSTHHDNTDHLLPGTLRDHLLLSRLSVTALNRRC